MLGYLPIDITFGRYGCRALCNFFAVVGFQKCAVGRVVIEFVDEPRFNRTLGQHLAFVEQEPDSLAVGYLAVFPFALRLDVEPEGKLGVSGMFFFNVVIISPDICQSWYATLGVHAVTPTACNLCDRSRRKTDVGGEPGL